MINVIGILIIIIASFSPFLTSGRIPALFFFWIGFLLLLRPNKNLRQTWTWGNWARLGLLAHVMGHFVVLLYSYLVIYTALSHSYFAGTSLRIFVSLVTPVASLMGHLFPNPHFEMADGRIVGIISFARASLTSFCDVATYLLIGAIVGKLKSNAG